MQLKSKIKKVFRFLGNPALYKYFIYNILKQRNLQQAPIIICGCPRSGTTLLMSILDSHPEIHVIPFETAVLQSRPNAKKVFKTEKFHFLFMKSQILAYLFSSKIKKTAVRWCEKTPLNILNVDEINKLFQGNVKFINIVRDGRAVVSSYHSRFGYMVKPDLWYNCLINGLKRKKMINFHTVRYEDLILSTDLTLLSMQEFLGLKEKFSIDWFNRTNVKGEIKSLVNGHVEGSLVTREMDPTRLDSWKGSKSPYLKQFLSNEKYLSINKELGYG